MGNLSIAIPTFRRDEILVEILENHECRKVASEFPITVLDDGNSRGLEDKVRSASPRVKFLKNAENQGFARSLVRLLRNCETRYMLLSADDDCLDLEGIFRLADHLERTNFDFLSPCSFDGLPRGRARTGPIFAVDIPKAANHAPGLVFKTKAVVSVLEFLDKLLDEKNRAAEDYPQVVIAYLLILNGHTLAWYDSSPVRTGFDAPSQFKDSEGRPYWSLPARVEQYLGFMEFFNRCIDELPTEVQRNLAQQMAQAREQDFFSIIDASLSLQMRGGAVYYLLRRPLRSLGALIRWAFARGKLKARWGG